MDSTIQGFYSLITEGLGTSTIKRIKLLKKIVNNKNQQKLQLLIHVLVTTIPVNSTQLYIMEGIQFKQKAL